MAAERAVRKHDFRRTDLVERVHLQVIQGLLETFSRTVAQRLTSTLHQPCHFEVDGLDQVTWADLVEEIEGLYFFTFSMSGLAGKAVIALPTDEVLALVDLRLAGSGEDDFTGRVPSEVDQAFLSPIIQDVINELATSLSRIQATQAKLEDLEGNVMFVQVAAPAEMCLVARCSFSVATREARTGVICLPIKMVRTLADRLESKSTEGADASKDAVAADARRRLMATPMDVVFQFPSITTTPAELMTLRVGDSLGLGHPKGRPLEVRAEGILVATAEMCSSGVHKACEIKEEVTR